MNAVDFAFILLRAVIALMLVLGLVPMLVWLERKGSAYIQDRPGPERAAIGPFRLGGLIHPLADAIKMIAREDIIPAGANKFYYLMAPVIIAAVAFTTITVLPFWDTIRIPGGPTITGQVLDLNVGVLWFFAIVSLTVYGVIFAGWASNNKYSLLGAMRASAAVLSYEIPMGLAVIAVVLAFGTVSLPAMVQAQSGTWFGVIPRWGLFFQPVAALIFTVCAFAETNRAPFDLAESESELVAGYHTEYSSMKFALFMLGEYGAMVVSSGLIATMFLGGWQVPYLTTEMLVANAGLITQWTLGIGFGLMLVLTVLFLNNFKNNYGRWRDMRDYEGLILALATLGAGLTMLLGLFVVMAISLPAWYGPVFAGVAQFGMFLLKVLFLCWVFVWVRWTLPRFRYDQVMNLGWRSLLPLALVNILVTGLVITVWK